MLDIEIASKRVHYNLSLRKKITVMILAQYLMMKCWNIFLMKGYIRQLLPD